MEKEEQRLECRIFGRVQLVMYRDFAKRKARKLGILGIVTNEYDGSVRVIAEGAAQRLDEFLLHLRKGSILSRVKTVDAVWRSSTGEFKTFNIVFPQQRKIKR